MLAKKCKMTMINKETIVRDRTEGDANRSAKTTP